MVWLGVDLGEARVGLALSDPGHSFAHPAGNIAVRGDAFRAIDAVIDMIEDESVECVVVGLPLQLNGSEGASARKARRWVHALEARIAALMQAGDLALPASPRMSLVDERLTTVSAHRLLSEAKVSGRRHRPVVDQQAAVVILQSALDCRERQGSEA